MSRLFSENIHDIPKSHYRLARLDVRQYIRGTMDMICLAGDVDLSSYL